jgi:hypothetical protein
MPGLAPVGTIAFLSMGAALGIAGLATVVLGTLVLTMGAVTRVRANAARA